MDAPASPVNWQELGLHQSLYGAKAPFTGSYFCRQKTRYRVATKEKIAEVRQTSERSVDLCEQSEALFAQAQQQIDRTRVYFWKKEIQKETRILSPTERT